MLIIFAPTVPFLRIQDLVRILATLSLFHLTMDGYNMRNTLRFASAAVRFEWAQIPGAMLRNLLAQTQFLLKQQWGQPSPRQILNVSKSLPDFKEASCNRQSRCADFHLNYSGQDFEARKGRCEYTYFA